MKFEVLGVVHLKVVVFLGLTPYTGSSETSEYSTLSVFFWVFPRRLIMVCRRFGTLYLFHLQRLDVKYEVWSVRGGRGIYTGAEVCSSWRNQ